LLQRGRRDDDDDDDDDSDRLVVVTRSIKPSAIGVTPVATPHLQRLQRYHANESLVTQR